MSRLVIALVGGIASGKTTVARLWAAERGSVHVDADAIARRVLARPEVRAALAHGLPGVGAKGRIDREMLAHRVFRDRRALAALEEVTHPAIRKAIVLAIRRARTPHVLLDAALLQETGADALADVVVYVGCPARKRRARTRRTRGWTEAHHRARELRQWSCRRKRAHADFAIDNGGPPSRTRREVRRLIRRIESRRHDAAGRGS
jgi:dephospho-CoA kinase